MTAGGGGEGNHLQLFFVETDTIVFGRFQLPWVEFSQV